MTKKGEQAAIMAEGLEVQEVLEGGVVGKITFLQTGHQDVLVTQERPELRLTAFCPVAVKLQEGSLSRWLRLEVSSVVYRISPTSIFASLLRR